MKEEIEEIVKSIQIKPFDFEKRQIYPPLDIVKPSKIDWLFPFDFTFDPGLLVNLGIFKNVETFSDIRSSF